jgi:crotonobetainyl-CoA:carnitine CoA-transferase CaiB-like acyl-CoA transferase
VPIIDLTTGMYATIAICAALANRAVTGKGQWIDVALLDTTVAYLANQGQNYLATGVSPERIGNAHPNIVPYQTFSTADGAIILACGNDNLFRKFCEVAGCMEFTTDPKFSTNAARVQNRAEITRLLNAVFARRPTREWVKLLDDAGVANGPINNLQHAVAGKVTLVASPMRFSGTPIKHEVPPPALGQHTDEILRTVLKKSDAEIAGLRAGGVV